MDNPVLFGTKGPLLATEIPIELELNRSTPLALPTYCDTAFLSAPHDRPHTETAFLRLKIRALGKGADTVYGVSYQVGTGVCVSGCIDGREKKPEA
jgi:hypothetical protein